MLRALHIETATSSGASVVADRVVLDHQSRHRRRAVLTGAGGLSFLLDLSASIQLRQDDRIVLEDGRCVLVEAAAEAVLDITADSAAGLTRIAWHLGNRHAPVELLGDRLRILSDHVLEAMVRGLGGQVSALDAPFTPERGAYDGAATQHGHGHD